MRKRNLVLAFLLALTAVVPVHAETVMDSELALPPLDETPVINVTVPSTGRIILNPYGMSVETSDGTSTEQIVSNTLPITNESTVPVVVSASAAGYISERSRMVFVSVPPPSDAREKAAFLYVEFQNEDGAWQDGYTGAENQLLISAAASAEKEVLTLSAGPSEGVFRVFGATSVSPDDPWCSDDAVSVTLTFTFAALTEPSEDAETASDGEAAVEPTEEAIEQPAEEPAKGPVEAPTEVPVGEPTGEPTGDPTVRPTEEPTGESVEDPTGEPTEEPTEEPTGEPAEGPTEEPTEEPTEKPTEEPTEKPTGGPIEGAAEKNTEGPANVLPQPDLGLLSEGETQDSSLIGVGERTEIYG